MLQYSTVDVYTVFYCMGTFAARHFNYLFLLTIFYSMDLLIISHDVHQSREFVQLS